MCGGDPQVIQNALKGPFIHLRSPVDESKCPWIHSDVKRWIHSHHPLAQVRSFLLPFEGTTMKMGLVTGYTRTEPMKMTSFGYVRRVL